MRFGPVRLVMVEAVARLLPGVLGNPESVVDDSFAPGPMESSSRLPDNGRTAKVFTNPEQMIAAELAIEPPSGMLSIRQRKRPCTGGDDWRTSRSGE